MFRCLTFAVLLAASSSAFAQDVSGSHLEAAHELLVISRAEERFQQAQELMLESMIDGSVLLAGLRPVLEGFIEDFASWEHVREEQARLYARHFEEGELRAMVEWYETPLGQKILRVQPTVMREGMEIGNSLVLAHQDELEARIEAHLSGGSVHVPPAVDPKKGAQ